MSNSAFPSTTHSQNTDSGTTGADFTVNSGAATKLVLTGGSNTFTIVAGGITFAN